MASDLVLPCFLKIDRFFISSFKESTWCDQYKAMNNYIQCNTSDMKISKCGVGGGQQQTVWTRIKLLYMEQSDSGPHCFRLATTLKANIWRHRQPSYQLRCQFSKYTQFLMMALLCLACAEMYARSPQSFYKRV